LPKDNIPQFHILTPVKKGSGTFWYRIGAGWEKTTQYGKSMVSCAIDLPVQGGRIIMVPNPQFKDSKAEVQDEPVSSKEYDDLPF